MTDDGHRDPPEGTPTGAAMKPTGLGEDDDHPSVRHPARLVRLTLAIRNTLDEIRTVELDDRAVDRLRAIHARTVASLEELLSDDLREELEEDVVLPPAPAGTTQAELQVSHARLMGWLEGLFQGLQATAIDQQLSAARLAHRDRRESREADEGAGYL
jgi:hypothetical protein